MRASAPRLIREEIPGVSASLGGPRFPSSEDDAPSPNRPLVYTSEEFLALELPPLEHVLDPILRVKNIAMLYAPRGSGKTWVDLSVAIVIAAGGKLFGRWHAPKGRHVLFLDGEMPAQILKERLALLERGMGLDTQGRLRILAADLQEDAIPSLATSAGQSYVDGALGPETEVVILDNISTLCGGLDENDAEAWGPVQSWLLSLRRRALTVILVHHAGKGGQQRGTSRREDVIDLTLALKLPEDYEPEEGARFEVHFEKTRGIFGAAVESFEAHLVTSSDGARWTVRNRREATLKRMLELDALGWSYSAIGKEIGINKSNVSRRLRKAKERSRGAS